MSPELSASCGKSLGDFVIQGVQQIRLAKLFSLSYILFNSALWRAETSRLMYSGIWEVLC